MIDCSGQDIGFYALQPRQRPPECAAVGTAVMGPLWNVKLETKTMSAEIRQSARFSILYPRDLTFDFFYLSEQCGSELRGSAVLDGKRTISQQLVSGPNQCTLRTPNQPFPLHDYPICIIAEHQFLLEKIRNMTSLRATRKRKGP